MSARVVFSLTEHQALVLQAIVPLTCHVCGQFECPYGPHEIASHPKPYWAAEEHAKTARVLERRGLLVAAEGGWLPTPLGVAAAALARRLANDAYAESCRKKGRTP